MVLVPAQFARRTGSRSLFSRDGIVYLEPGEARQLAERLREAADTAEEMFSEEAEVDRDDVR